MQEENKDIRWQQRFINFNKALNQLEKFIAKENLNELGEQGLIKAFEYTYELAWKTLQDLLKHKGYDNILGPKPVIDQSFQDGYINDGKGWINMHKSRNLTSHTYNEETANEIVTGIRNSYFQLLKDLQTRLSDEQSKENKSLFE
jgi:nucleotidyltransferase substrate binding protein (TIGR01987 family)